LSDIFPLFSVVQAQALSKKPSEAQQRSCQCQRSHFRNSGKKFNFFLRPKTSKIFGMQSAAALFKGIVSKLTIKLWMCQKCGKMKDNN
jgi:hypothetical protein